AGGEPDPAERVRKAANLLMPRRVRELSLERRLAAAHDAPGAVVVEHLLGVRAVPALQLDRGERRDAASPRELLSRLHVVLAAGKRLRRRRAAALVAE